jgi:hypothetical protein
VIAGVLAAIVLMTGCEGGEEPDGEPTSVAAYPDLPHFDGRAPVELASGLWLMADTPCTPEPAEQRVCAPDGRAYRLLGEGSRATVVDVRVAPSELHTSWTATVRFDDRSRDALRAARTQAAGLGGMVVVTAHDKVLLTVRPDAVSASKMQAFDLEKPEAWRLASAFGGGAGQRTSR